MTTDMLNGLMVALQEVVTRAEGLRRDGDFTLPKYAELVLEEVEKFARNAVPSVEDLKGCAINYNYSEE